LFRPILSFTALCLLLICAAAWPIMAQQNKATPTPKPTPPPTPKKASGAPAGPVTAEQVAESVIFANGSRGVLEQIRRNGLERGHITRIAADGHTEEATYERRFVRGADSSKDKIRMDQKMPTLEYSLVYGDGRLWGIINGSAFTPRQDAAASFMSQHWHSIDALLRYKENGSTIAYGGKEKRKGVDVYVVDLTDKEQRKTRYYISAKFLKVLWLEYEEAPDAGAPPVKYTRKFFDYRLVQQTPVPYRTELLANDKLIQETRISTVTYSVKLEDSMFRNPEAQASSNP
jgi:hypothetical protein